MGQMRKRLDELGLAFKLLNPNAARAMTQAGHGFRTQWMGLDDKGALRPPISSDWDAPQEEWVWNDEAQMALPPQRQTRPGIVDETIALPTFFGYKGSETMNEAGQRVQNLDTALRAQHDIPEAETWADYLGGAAGIMAGQLPVPSGIAKGAAGALGRFVPKVVKAAANLPVVKQAGALLGSVPEFMLPTIEPSLQNYALGTGAGAALTKYLPELLGGEEVDPSEDLIDWSDPSLDSMIRNDLESGAITPEEAEEFLSLIAAQRAKLEAPTEETSMTGGKFAKGGKVTPIKPAEKPDEKKLRELLNSLDEPELPKELLDRIGIEHISPMKKAKGGKVPPTKLGLRDRIRQLLSEAGVQGTGREVVPVDPLMTETNLPAPDDFVLPESMPTPPDTNLPEPQGTVSRRDILRGMRDLAGATMSPVDPMSMVDIKLDDLVEAVAPAAKAVRTFSIPRLANALQIIADNVFEGSEDSVEILANLAKEAGETPQLARVAPLLAKVAELERRVAYDELDPEAPEYMDGWTEGRTQIIKSLEDIADEAGVTRLPGHDPAEFGADAIEFEEATPPLFAEPPEGGRHILDDAVSSYENMAKTEDFRPEDAETLAELKKLRDHLGDRADAVFAEYWMSNRQGGYGPYQLDKAMEELKIDPSLMDAIVDSAESHYIQWGGLDEWVNADPATRQKYRDLRDQLAKIAEEHPYDSPRGEQELMAEYHKTWDEIFPGRNEDSGTRYEDEVRARQIANDLRLDDEEQP